MMNTFISLAIWYLFGMITVIICQDKWEYWYKKALYILCFFVCFYFINTFLL